MAPQTKKQRSDAAKKAARTRRKQSQVAPAGVVTDTSDLRPPTNRDPLGTTPTDQAGAVLLGHFATVTKGDDKGAYGVVTEVVSRKPGGWPDKVAFRTRDDRHARLVVNYADLEPDEAGGRR